MAADWELLLKNTLEDSFLRTRSEAERDTIASLYPLPYTSSCRDMARCKQLLREGRYDDYFHCIEGMMTKYEDCFFLHALTIDTGYALVEGRLDAVVPPMAFTEWVERLIAQKGTSVYWDAYYRATAAALVGNVEAARREHDRLKAALEESGYDEEFKTSLRQHADRLWEAAQRHIAH